MQTSWYYLTSKTAQRWGKPYLPKTKCLLYEQAMKGTLLYSQDTDVSASTATSGWKTFCTRVLKPTAQQYVDNPLIRSCLKIIFFKNFSQLNRHTCLTILQAQHDTLVIQRPVCIINIWNTSWRDMRGVDVNSKEYYFNRIHFKGNCKQQHYTTIQRSLHAFVSRK